MIGTVTGRKIGKNQDGDNNVLLLQVQMTDPIDVQTVQLITQAGEDYNPPDGSKVIVIPIRKNWKIGIAVDDLIEPSMDEGERKLYSSENGAIKAFINLLVDGVMELNGNADFAVRFNKLEEGFNQFRDDFNTFRQTIYALHTHPDPVSGNTGTPSLTGANTNASIADAKIDEIKVP